MDYNGNSQISDHLHNSTTVWTQPQTEEQRRYYSKHAAEKRVFGWITTIFQGAHGFIAFAAWTGIYIWLFQRIPFLIPVAPFLSGATLMALHVLFRTTWQTFWYDKLDNDPNTDSPIWVPLIIIIVLLAAEIRGFQEFLTGQIKPAEKQGTEQVHSEHATTVASLEQSYRNDCAAISATYKEKERASTLTYERQIRSARNRSADTPEERRERANRIAALERQRDQALAPVLSAKAAALEQALTAYNTSKNAATTRRDQAVAHIDTQNHGEDTRVQSERANVNTYAWVLSVALLLLIAGLSYRTVRINVKSGIIPLRNYTVLDAHGSIPERIWTAITDALNRRSLQFAVWLHRLFSPKDAITSFDGTVVAKPGTYNTPKGFFPPPSSHLQNPSHPDSTPSDEELRRKVADKILREAAAGRVVITPELLQSEFEAAKRSNGHYKDSPLGKHEPSPAPSARPAEGHTVTPPQQRHTTPTPPDDDEARYIDLWKKMTIGLIQAYDKAILEGRPGEARALQDELNDPTGAPYKLGKRLGLSWGIYNGDIYVWRDRTPGIKIRLKDISPATLDAHTPTPSPSEASDDDEMFKQNVSLFKQNILPHTDDAGRVIGIKYRKKDGNWTAYDYNTVRGQWGIYLRRAQKGEVSQAVTDGLEKWEYAMSLFEEGRRELRENLQTVTL